MHHKEYLGLARSPHQVKRALQQSLGLSWDQRVSMKELRSSVWMQKQTSNGTTSPLKGVGGDGQGKLTIAFVRQRFSQRESWDIQEAVLGGGRCESGKREAGDQKPVATAEVWA